MSTGNEIKSKQLNMPFGTAGNQLRKMIMFDLAKKCEMDTCYRCNKKIDNIDDFTIEHKVEWLHSETPVELFFNLGNIAFSHGYCNRKAARSPKQTGKIRDNTDAIYKGVTFRKEKNYKNPWKAVYTKNGYAKYIGMFSTAELAAEAYDKKVIEVFGENAVTNRSLGLLLSLPCHNNSVGRVADL